MPPHGTGAMQLRVGIIDDHPLFRGGLDRLISDADGMTLACSVGSLDEFTQIDPELDVLVLDLYLGVMDPEFQAIRALSERFPILVLSSSALGSDILDAIEAGAAGYLTKQASNETTVRAIRAVAAHETYLSSQLADAMAAEANGREAEGSDPVIALSPREREVLRMIAEGFTHAQGARRMGISEGTFDTYVKRVREKFGLGNKAQLVMKAVEMGVIDGSGPT